MKRRPPQWFAGRVTARGELDAATIGRCSAHQGCSVLFRGYLADAAAAGSECAAIARAFRAWSHDLPAKLDGEYAAAIHDPASHRTLLTHDALGMVPLFYSERDQGLVFTTDLSDLIDTTSRDDLDEDYLADFLAIGSITSERTPYRGIKRLLPGQSLWWSSGGSQLVTAWRAGEVEPIRYGRDEEYEERFRAELHNAVRSAAAHPGGRTWVSLSGGLDSSSIACVAAQLGVSGLAAYSLVASCFADYDERRWMQPVVERCAIPWQQVEVETVLPFSRLPSSFLGEPTQAVLDEAELSQRNALLAEHGVDVLLSGHGGDGVLGVSRGTVPPHLADPLFEHHPLEALGALRRWQRGSKDRRSHAFWLTRALLQPSVDHLRGQRVRAPDRAEAPSWLRRDYAERMKLHRRAARRIASPCRTPGAQAFWDGVWFCALGLATNSPRHWPFQIRNPLMARSLVEFMAAIPRDQVLQPRCDRYLQRRALKGVLPEIVRRRAAKATATSLLVEGLWRSPEWQDYLCDDPMLARHGIAHADAWRQAVRQASVGQTHGDKFFIAAVAVEVWFKQLREFAAGLRQPNTALPEMVAGPGQ